MHVCASQACDALVSWAKSQPAGGAPRTTAGGTDEEETSLAEAVLAAQRGLLVARSAEELLAALEHLPC